MNKKLQFLANLAYQQNKSLMQGDVLVGIRGGSPVQMGNKHKKK